MSIVTSKQEGVVKMQKIMIIDSDIRQMCELNEGLSNEYRILNCSRGAQAMELFKLYQPSALLLDPTTAELKSIDFVRQVRSFPNGSHLPILALTQITSLRHLEDCFNWDVDMIFSKPCSTEKIKKKLNEHLGRTIRPLVPESLLI